MTTERALTQPIDPAEVGDNFAIRAAAHSAEPAVLRVAQRWHDPKVTDLAVARVFLALELNGTRPYRGATGRWYAPTGTALSALNPVLGSVISEMVRTGLVRHWRDRDGDHLIPAPVHYRVRVALDQPAQVLQHSACLFVGEDMGPMRARLVDRLDLVDCLACEQAIATGQVPRL